VVALFTIAMNSFNSGEPDSLPSGHPSLRQSMDPVGFRTPDRKVLPEKNLDRIPNIFYKTLNTVLYVWRIT